MAARAIEPVAIAVLAKAPIPGFAKTRLIPALGAAAAALFQARLIERALASACAADIGPVRLWCAPDEGHSTFAGLRARFNIVLARQPDGDLGARMLAALASANAPALVVGTDCPAMTAEHLRAAAEALRAGTDAVVVPTEDGGYALIGAREPQPALFSGLDWSTAGVMVETRRRLSALRLAWSELEMLWDVDVPEDLERLRHAGMQHLVPEEPRAIASHTPLSK